MKYLHSSTLSRIAHAWCMLIFLSMSSAWATLPQPGQDMRSVCALIGTEVDALLGTFTVINTDFNATLTAIAALSTLITRDFNFTMTAIAGVSSLVTTDFNNTFTTIAALGACVPIVLSQASVSNGGILLTTSGASYCLSQNITGSIIISASDVTVDLNTHSLLGTIDIISTVINATIKNGKVKPAAPTNTTDAAHAAIVIAGTVDKALIKNCYVVCSDSTLIGIVGRDGIANGGTNTIINSCFIQAGAGGLSSNGGNGVTVTNSTSEILNCTITAGAGGGATVFVADEGGITITSFPIPANTPVAAITVGNNPNAIAITPDRTKAYVVNYNGGSGPAGADTVSVINIATGAVTKTIGGFSGPFAIAITPDGTKAYVVNNIANGGLFTVSVINTATDTIIGSPITVGSSPTSIAITPDGTKAYVTNSAPDNTVSVITIATNTVTTTIPTSGKFNNPWAIAITPNGQFAYVVNSGGTPGTVIPITIATNALGANITVGNLPKGIAITPDGTMAYVTNDTDHTVTPITLSTNTPLTSLSGSFSNPYGIAITSDGKTAYVTNSVGSGFVTPITLATSTFGASISIGIFPTGITITPPSLGGNGISQQGNNGKIIKNITTGGVGGAGSAAGGNGIEVTAATNANIVQECLASNCGRNGFSMLTTGTVDLLKCVANYNASSGFDLASSTGKGLVKYCIASQNIGCGFNDSSSSLYQYIGNVAQGNGSTPGIPTGDSNYCDSSVTSTFVTPSGAGFAPYYQNARRTDSTFNGTSNFDNITLH